MSTRNLIIALVTAIVVFALVLHFLPYNKPDTTGNATPPVTTTDFFSPELGFGFRFPNKYFLQTELHGNAERRYTALTLLESLEQPANSEGPVHMAIDVYPNNVDHYTAESWIRNNANSNFKLSDGILNKTTLSNQPAISYHWSGLYEADSIVVGTDSFIYTFTVNYIASEDQIRKDYYELLKTVSFAQE